MVASELGQRDFAFSFLPILPSVRNILRLLILNETQNVTILSTSISAAKILQTDEQQLYDLALMRHRQHYKAQGFSMEDRQFYQPGGVGWELSGIKHRSAPAREALQAGEKNTGWSG